jgi:hypothetical protein
MGIQAIITCVEMWCVAGCGFLSAPERASVLDPKGSTGFTCSEYRTRSSSGVKPVVVTVLQASEKGAVPTPGSRRLVLAGEFGAMAVSADGKQIALAVGREGNDGNNQYTLTIVDSETMRKRNEWVIAPAAGTQLFRINRMDMLSNRVAVLTFCSVDGCWDERIHVYDSADGHLTSTCSLPWKYAHRFDVDISLSPDGEYVAFYGYYLAPRFPRSIDVFYPYSQKKKGYLAIWHLPDGALIGSRHDNVFYPDNLGDNLKVKKDNSGRPCRMAKSLEMGWRRSGKSAEVVLPDGSTIGQRAANSSTDDEPVLSASGPGPVQNNSGNSSRRKAE